MESVALTLKTESVIAQDFIDCFEIGVGINLNKSAKIAKCFVHSSKNIL